MIMKEEVSIFDIEASLKRDHVLWCILSDRILISLGRGDQERACQRLQENLLLPGREVGLHF